LRGTGTAAERSQAGTFPTVLHLRERVAALEWYHTLELAPGVVTPGWFDTRSVAAELPLPARLDGMRCLDVGTFDGFWAFDLERRGAREVVALDLLDPYEWDWPVNSGQDGIDAIATRKGKGDGFLIAHEALGSSVRRVEGSVYDLATLDVGTFDFVYVGSLLLHLRDPVGALQAVRQVCAGQLLLVDAIDLTLTVLHRRNPVAALDGSGRPWWWKPNLAGLQRMAESAGFEAVRPAQRVYLPPGRGWNIPRLNPLQLLTRSGRATALIKRRGDPHGAVLCRPVGEGRKPARPPR
jgi:tRNA (mo5U34)-methyltransferase